MVRRQKGYRFMRNRWNVTSLLLASTALLTLGTVPQAAAEPHDGSIVVAQAGPPAEGRASCATAGPASPGSASGAETDGPATHATGTDRTDATSRRRSQD